ncbi:MAG: PIN/TRAM domain-containing protein [Planctomycetota bacterium]|jgi:uncharacterized protein YacL
MTLRILLRILFIIFATGFALQACNAVYGDKAWDDKTIPVIYAAIAAVVAMAIVFFESRFQRSLVREIVAIAFGLAAGIIVSVFVIGLTIAFVLPAEATLNAAFSRIQIWIPLMMTAICYISVTIVLQTRGDFRFLVPYIDFSDRGQEEGGVLLDTSVLVDGRIVDISLTNIIGGILIIPDFVLRELQTLADSSDKMKRKRGRRGLDVVSTLQKSDVIRVQIRETDIAEKCDVDMELVNLARRINGKIATNDFNLNKVAQIDGVKVININELANALKPVVLPGEKIFVMVIRVGDEEGQGVGYLDDGTMVVIEGGRDYVQQAIEVTITGSIQTSAGKLVFAKYGSSDKKDKQAESKNA